MRGEDGRGPVTSLQSAIAGHYGMASAAAVSAAIHLGELPEPRLRAHYRTHP